MLNVTNLMQEPTLPLANFSRDGEGEGQGTDHSHRRNVRGHVYFVVAMSIPAAQICDIVTFCQVCQHGKRVPAAAYCCNLPLPIVAICRCLLLQFAFNFFSFTFTAGLLEGALLKSRELLPLPNASPVI